MPCPKLTDFILPYLYVARATLTKTTAVAGNSSMYNHHFPNYFSPFSEEHRFGRLFCWHIREGVRQRVEAGRIARYIQCFWLENLCHHFKEEEALLLRTSPDEVIWKAWHDHGQLNACIHQLIKADNAVTAVEVLKVADLLEDHIHFEEKTMFPSLAARLSRSELRDIGLQLRQTPSISLKNLYPDEFWKIPGSSL